MVVVRRMDTSRAETADGCASTACIDGLLSHFDVMVNVWGVESSGQAGAVRHADACPDRR